MIITREKGMRMWGGGSGSTSASGVNGGGGFSLAVTEGEGTGNAYTDFTYESGILTLNKGSEFVTVDFFNKLFTAYDSDGNAILPNDVTSTINNLKLLVGTWTEEYLSALGKNSEGGGGGGVDLTAVWASLTNTDSPTYSETLKININHIPNIGWSKIDNKPTTLSGYGITDAKIANGTITLGSNTITPLTASSSLAWGKLTGTPTTLAGYGIGDAKIANGVITLGSSTITPVTSVAMTVPAGFSVSGSPITKTGTLALTYATGYEGFTTALKEKIEALYSWFEVDANGDVKTKDTAGGHVRGLYSESFVSSLGKNSSSGGGGVDLTAVWASLTNTDSPTYSETLKININHIPNIGWSKIDNKPTTLSGYGITDAKIANGTITLGSNTITPLTSSSSLAWGKLTGTPTTLSGYGISDAYTKTQVDNALDGYLVRKTYSISGKSAVRITFNNVNGGIISARVTKQSGSLVLIGNGYGDEGIVRNNWVQISKSTSYFSWCIPTATGIEKSVEIYNNDTTTASIVVASFDTNVTFTELSALSTTASTVKVAYASDYLPLSGGTMTGTLTTPKIRINTRHSSNNKTGGIYYYDGTTDYLLIGQGSANLWIGANETAGTHHTGDTYISAGSGNTYISRLVNNTRNAYLILDSGNYSSYALPLSGGQMTGELTWKNATALSGVTSTNYVLCIDGFADGGTTHYITTANLSVGSATKATQDGSGRTITSTYLTSVGISGDSLVQTKGGTTSSVANIFYRDCTVQYTLSTAGWYRIAAFSTNLAHGGTCFLLIRRTFNNTSPESYIFAITLRYGSGISISQLSGSYGVALIDKIRVEYANNTSFAPQIDIHVSSTTNGNAYRITTIGSAAAFATATLNPTVANSTYEYTTRNGMSCSGDFYAGGEVTAASDERLKIIVGDGNLDLRYIANAPNILFKWNNGQDDKVHGGSLAQYFLTGAKHFVLGSDKDYYSLNYGALATSMAISIAKEVVKHDDEITRLKKEVVKLRERVAELEERRA